MVQKQKILNLWAGPGSGKSTTAALVFGILKSRGYNVELVREYAKELVWEHGEITIDQDCILSEQQLRQEILYGKVDLIITDSPLRMSVIYGSNPHRVDSMLEGYEEINVFVSRVKPYNAKGRLQTEDEARKIDDIIWQQLRQEDNFLSVTGNVLGAWDLADKIEGQWLK